LKNENLPDERALAASPLAWITEKLHSHLSLSAKQANPAFKMKYAGLVYPKDPDDLISYFGAIPNDVT
jgi:cytochrome c2